MTSWLIFSVRAAASAFMGMLGLVMLAFCVSKFEWAVFIIGLLFAGAGFFSFPRMPNAWRRDPPTQKQLAYANRLGLDVPQGISKGELSKLISSVTGR